MFSFLWSDFLFRNSRVGLEAGYFYIPGIDSLEDKGQKVERINFAPFGIKAGYQFLFGKSRLEIYIVRFKALYYSLKALNRGGF